MTPHIAAQVTAEVTAQVTGQVAARVLRDCKRLAEVDFTIAEVSKHAAREKSIQHRHPSTPALRAETP